MDGTNTETHVSGGALSFRGEQLTKIYRTGETEVKALRGIDFSIVAGEMLVPLGPSGSGKSTFLNIVGGLDRPTSGTLRYNDLNLPPVATDEVQQNHPCGLHLRMPDIDSMRGA